MSNESSCTKNKVGIQVLKPSETDCTYVSSQNSVH